MTPPDLSKRPFRLVVEHEMAAAPAVLYRAWTEQLDRWFAVPGSVVMEGEIGSVYFFETAFEGTRYSHYGRFLRLERDRLVELTWVTSETGGFETVVTVMFAPHNTGTRLTLTHAGFADEPARQRHADAWPIVLAQMNEKYPA